MGCGRTLGQAGQAGSRPVGAAIARPPVATDGPVAGGILHEPYPGGLILPLAAGNVDERPGGFPQGADGHPELSGLRAHRRPEPEGAAALVYG